MNDRERDQQGGRGGGDRGASDPWRAGAAGEIPELSAAQVSRHLKRLRTHGLIKRVGRTYKYYLTKAGRTVALAGLKLRSLVLIPELATTPPS